MYAPPKAASHQSGIVESMSILGCFGLKPDIFRFRRRYVFNHTQYFIDAHYNMPKNILQGR